MNKLKKVNKPEEKVDNERSVKSRRLVPALDRSVQILDMICVTDQRLTISEISRRMGIPKSTVHGICVTLLEHELLLKRDDQSFRIGPHIMRWANTFKRTIDVTDEFLSVWDSESEFPGATITLSVLDGADVVYIAARNSDRYHDFFTFSVGARLPAAFTATGKAFLMCMREREVRALFSEEFPDALTPASVRSLDALLEELKRFRELGYTIDNEQVKEGMRCFGKTVLNSWNAPIAGLAVSIPADAISAEEEQNIVASLESMAETISRRMGADVREIGS